MAVTAPNRTLSAFTFRMMVLVTKQLCHRVVPLAFAAAMSIAVLVVAPHVLVGAIGALVSLVIAHGIGTHYALTAIGPVITDVHSLATWTFIGRRIVKLFLVLLAIPATVVTVFAVLRPFTPFSTLLALSSAIPAIVVAKFALSLDARSWSWRVRRGMIIRSATEMRARIARHQKHNNSADRRFWAGEYVPRELLAPHYKLFGMTESAKTVSIRLYLQSFIPSMFPGSDRQLVVYDPKRELYSYILGMQPNCPVYLLDPTDKRGYAWDVAHDVTDANGAKVVAALLVPDDKKLTQPYFRSAAARILEGVLRYLIRNAPGNWNLQDAFMILEDIDLLKQVLPRHLVRKYFRPEATLKNTLATLDTLTARFETVVACWAKAEAEGRTISLGEFARPQTTAILVVPRRLDLAEAMDATNRLIFERLTQHWLARPDQRFLPGGESPETIMVIDEAAKAGTLTRLDDLLLMGRAKGVSVILAAQDVEALRQEYGQREADSLLGQCGNTAVFKLDSPDTREYCSSLFGTFEEETKPGPNKTANLTAAITVPPEQLYQSGTVREQKTVLPSQFAQLERAKDTGRISGFFITGGLGPHFANYPLADLLKQPANVPPLMPRSAADQELPDALSSADFARLGIPARSQNGHTRKQRNRRTVRESTPNSLRHIKRLGPKQL